MIRNSLLLVLLFTFSVGMQAQKTTAKVNQFLQKAKDSIAVGNTDAGMKFLEQAEKLAPDNAAIQFEKAYVLYVEEAYEQSVTLLQKLLETSQLKEDYYMLLGTNYDSMHQPDSAIIAYNEGLQHFPKSGQLYYESGIVEFQRQQYKKAVSFWETGIKKEPNYSGNYYMLAKLFSFTKEKIWVLLYGELFMNLEPNTERTSEIGRLLFNVYQYGFHPHKNSENQFFVTETNDSLSFEYNFSKVLSSSAASLQLRSPLNIDAIHAVRKQFLLHWYSEPNSYATQFPNTLIAYQRELVAKGCFETYTYWLLSEGNFTDFDNWYQQHQNSYQQLLEFITNKTFSIDVTQIYARTDYDN